MYIHISYIKKVDRTDLREYGLDWIRGQMALVGQEPVLFGGSIVDNIRLGCQPEPSFEDVREACRVANAAGFIELLPDVFRFSSA
jgi:ABC-type multidrug transport system fused ATPase/permease subunit